MPRGCHVFGSALSTESGGAARSTALHCSGPGALERASLEHAPLEHASKDTPRLAPPLKLRLGLVLASWLLGSMIAPCQAATGDGEPPDNQRIYLWPDRTAPGSVALPLQQKITERSADPSLPDRIITGVTQPYLVMYRPEKPNGIGLLVTPGGGYQRIVLDKEGTALVPAFADSGGVTLFVLRYRLPGEGHASGADAPLADTQRALRLIRARAREWQLDPERIGVMGFSAGGHAAASLGTRFDDKVYEPLDAADALSARPDFMLLIYPVISMDSAIAHSGSRTRLLGEQPTVEQERLYSAEQRVSASTPPAFLLHAEDDEVVVSENSLRMHAALRAAGVPVELHLYADGGHGFGVRETTGLPVALWPQLALRWMRAMTGITPIPVKEN